MLHARCIERICFGYDDRSSSRHVDKYIINQYPLAKYDIYQKSLKYVVRRMYLDPMHTALCRSIIKMFNQPLILHLDIRSMRNTTTQILPE